MIVGTPPVDTYAVPLFTAIYSHLPAPERPRFEHLDLTFHLDERRITLDELALKSHLLGHSADPVFARLIDFLTQNIIRIHLFGFLRDLKAEERWLTESSPRRPPIPPLPPVMSRRPRLAF